MQMNDIWIYFFDFSDKFFCGYSVTKSLSIKNHAFETMETFLKPRCVLDCRHAAWIFISSAVDDVRIPTFRDGSRTDSFGDTAMRTAIHRRVNLKQFHHNQSFSCNASLSALI